MHQLTFDFRTPVTPSKGGTLFVNLSNGEESVRIGTLQVECSEQELHRLTDLIQREQVKLDIGY